MGLLKWLLDPMLILPLVWLGFSFLSVKLARRMARLQRSEPLANAAPRPTAGQILVSIVVGSVAGAVAVALAHRIGEPIKQVFMPAGLIILVVGTPYVWRLFDRNIEISPVQRWLASAITLPFICGSWLGGITLSVARLLA